MWHRHDRNNQIYWIRLVRKISTETLIKTKFFLHGNTQFIKCFGVVGVDHFNLTVAVRSIGIKIRNTEEDRRCWLCYSEASDISQFKLIKTRSSISKAKNSQKLFNNTVVLIVWTSVNLTYSGMLTSPKIKIFP